MEKACRLIEEAARNDAKVVGFGEGFVPTFPHWASVNRAKPLKDRLASRYLTLFKNAVEVPSRATDELCQAARESDCYVVIGINEKDPGTMGTMYNSQLFIDRMGRLLGKHRKLVPTLGERLVHTGGDGSTLRVFDTDLGRLGGLICGEHNNLLAKYALFAWGESIHVASWPAFMCNWGGDFILQQYAYEGKVFVISASDFISPETQEELRGDLEVSEMGGGSSGIYGPRGQILAKAKTDREEILYADVDPEEIIKAKMSHDITGHYNRFDVFKLTVNEEALSPIGTLPRTSGARPKGPEVEEPVTPPPLKKLEVPSHLA